MTFEGRIIGYYIVTLDWDAYGLDLIDSNSVGAYY